MIAQRAPRDGTRWAFFVDTRIGPAKSGGAISLFGAACRHSTAQNPFSQLSACRLEEYAHMATIQEPRTTELDEREMLSALTALKRGDFSVRLPVEWTGLAGKIADTFNDVIELNERMADELDRLGRVVGKEGKISERASLGDVSGSWSDS